MKQTAAFARVSTQRQEESRSQQVAAIEEYATHEGYALRKDLYFLDEAVSGRNGRPAWSVTRPEGEGVPGGVCLSLGWRVYMLQVLCGRISASRDTNVVCEPASGSGPRANCSAFKGCLELNGCDCERMGRALIGRRENGKKNMGDYVKGRGGRWEIWKKRVW
ncbi:recombinase family protein [Candidatus Amarolinea dominans]|uniref:recombinase family protein n=1 Tax=Candidatus Amarolinea dominans TaxID=3140696 RepID=UPI001D3F27C6|nr:recombinase family protein [Anaerolineae bacterium]